MPPSASLRALLGLPDAAGEDGWYMLCSAAGAGLAWLSCPAGTLAKSNTTRAWLDGGLEGLWRLAEAAGMAETGAGAAAGVSATDETELMLGLGAPAE